MRRQPSPILFRIVALDERNLIGSLVRQVVPAVVGVVLHAECAYIAFLLDSAYPTGESTLTTNAVGVDEAHGDEVVLGVEITPVRHCERLVRDGVPNGAPDVDNAHTSLQETVCVGTKMAVDASNARVEGLINVNAFLCASDDVRLDECLIMICDLRRGREVADQE